MINAWKSHRIMKSNGDTQKNRMVLIDIAEKKQCDWPNNKHDMPVHEVNSTFGRNGRERLFC